MADDPTWGDRKRQADDVLARRKKAEEEKAMAGLRQSPVGRFFGYMNQATDQISKAPGRVRSVGRSVLDSVTGAGRGLRKWLGSDGASDDASGGVYMDGFGNVYPDPNKAKESNTRPIYLSTGERLDYDGSNDGSLKFDDFIEPKLHAGDPSTHRRLIDQSDPLAYNAGANAALGVRPREAAKFALPPSQRYLSEVAGAQARNAATQARTQRYSPSDFGAPDADEMRRRFQNLRPEQQQGPEGELMAAQMAALGQPKNPNDGKGARSETGPGLRDLLAADRNNISRERLAYEMERDKAKNQQLSDEGFEKRLLEVRKLQNPQDQLEQYATMASELMSSGIDPDLLQTARGQQLRKLFMGALAGQPQVTEFFRFEDDPTRGPELTGGDTSRWGLHDRQAQFRNPTGDPTYFDIGDQPITQRVLDELSRRDQDLRKKDK